MEHLFDEYEAAAASAKPSYRSPPPSVASTQFTEREQDAQSQYESNSETSIWTKYYPRPRCPPGPQGYPKARSPEEYKAFFWKGQREQSIDSPRAPRPNLPGFGVRNRSAATIQGPISKLPGFGNYRRDAPSETPANATQRTPSTWEAALQAVNAASRSSAGGFRNAQQTDLRAPRKTLKPSSRTTPNGTPELMPVMLTSPSKGKGTASTLAGHRPASAAEAFAAPRSVSKDRSLPAAAAVQPPSAQHSKSSLTTLIEAVNATPRTPAIEVPPVVGSPMLAPALIVKPGTAPAPTAADAKRKQLPKLVIPDTGEEAPVDKVTLADALAMLSASVLEKTDLDVMEILKLGLEQSKIRRKRDRGEKSASSASNSAGPSPRSRPPFRKRIRQRASKASPSSSKGSAGHDGLSPPSASTGASSASPLTPLEPSKLSNELVKDDEEEVDLIDTQRQPAEV